MSKGKPVIIHVHGDEGIGDNFYQRPTLMALSRRYDLVALTTPWPWIYHDIPHIEFVKPEDRYRIQTGEVRQLPDDTWNHDIAKEAAAYVRTSYGNHDFKRGLTVVDAKAMRGQTEPVSAPMTLKPEWIEEGREELRKLGITDPRKLGLVHPTTVRSEWMCSSRNPRARFLQNVIDARPDLTWLSTAWLCDKQEWLDDEPLKVDIELHGGEIHIKIIAALVAMAGMVLCGPCFLLPMAMNLGVGKRAMCIFGGNVKPELLIDELLGEAPVVLAPEPFCACLENTHDCYKHVTPNQVAEAIAQVEK